MQASNGALVAGDGVVVLDESGVYAPFIEGTKVIGLTEQAAIVMDQLRGQQDDIFNAQGLSLHFPDAPTQSFAIPLSYPRGER